MQTSVWWQQARDVGSDEVPAVPELVLVRQGMKPVVKAQGKSAANTPVHVTVCVWSC